MSSDNLPNWISAASAGLSALFAFFAYLVSLKSIRTNIAPVLVFRRANMKADADWELCNEGQATAFRIRVQGKSDGKLSKCRLYNSLSVNKSVVKPAERTDAFIAVYNDMLGNYYISRCCGKVSSYKIVLFPGEVRVRTCAGNLTSMNGWGMPHPDSRVQDRFQSQKHKLKACGGRECCRVTYATKAVSME